MSSQQFDAFVGVLKDARRLAKPFDRSKNPFDQINRDFICSPSASYMTDQSGIFIVWSTRAGDLYYSADYGCDPDRNKKLYDGIDKAPDELGLLELIGKPGPTTLP